MTSVEIADRIEAELKKKGIKKSVFYEKCGISRASFSQWKHGIHYPTRESLDRVNEFLGLAFSVTETAELPAYESKPTVIHKGIKIPVLGDVAAGIPIEAITDILDYEEIEESLARTGDFFGLRIKGKSMEPRMMEGDVVIVRKQETADTGDTVVALVNGNSATVKKIKYEPNGIALIPTNSSFDTMFYSAEEVKSLPVQVIGKVVELRAKY